MRLSKATLAAALALAFAAPWAAAAGVSSVSVKSSLYEPLRADVRIALGPQDDYSAGAFKIASRERFAAAGVEYPQAVGDLSLTHERATGRPGEAVLRIASSRPVYEPVLRLVLEARLADNSHVYLPVTVMLDTAFERPLGSASLEASLPSGAAQTAAKPAAIKSAPKRERPAGSKPAPRPAAKPATAPAEVSAPAPISAPVSDAKANASPSSAKPASAPVSDANANVSTSAAAPAIPAASPSGALADGSAAAAASLPASEDAAIATAPADPTPSAASPALDPAAPTEPAAAPAQIAPPAPIAPPAEPEPSWMDSAMEFWPIAAGLAGLGALAGLLALRRRKQGAAQNVDTEGDGSQVHEPSLGPSTFDPADQGPPTEASTDFGPADAPRSFSSSSGRASIDDLQAQIFSDDPMASLVDALDHEAKADAVDTRGYDPMGDLSAPSAQPSFDPDFGMAFELPAVDEPQRQEPSAGLDSIGELDAAFSLEKTIDASPSLAKASQAVPLDFEPSFSTPLQEPAHEPAPLDFELPSFDSEPISIGALEMEPQPEDDFSQTIAMAQAIQARSAGPAALAFDIAPTLGDVDGRVQLELACLYAQAGDWAEASAQLKEVISDEDLAPSHAEARRLLGLIP